MFRPLILLTTAMTVSTWAQDAKVLPVTIKTPPGQMKYDLASFDVPPGTKVSVVLENNDEMPHNLVITKPSNDKGLALAQKAWELGEKGVEQDWVPADERVLFSGKMAPPHGKATYDFTAPAEPGNYPYVCTFPGHAMSMNGVMRVAIDGPKIADLKFKLYQGSWQKLPDFTTLTPSHTGELANGLLGWKFDDYKNQFGMEFEGKLKAEKKGKYTFFLASDDGAEILIDGKSILKRDGIHPSGEPETREVKLDPGDHTIGVRYFQQAGEAELYVAWAGPGFSETPLSSWVPDSRKDPANRAKAGDKNGGIVLAPEPDRAIIYRNFLEGSSPRGIAVGFPSHLNLCFDADQMSVSMLWRGAFIDAKRHWTDRGGGNQPPLGYAVLKPAGQEQGLAVLADPNTTPWPKHEQRAAGLQFKGYHLDAKGFPTFAYTMGGLTVQESYETTGTDADLNAKIVRIIRLSGSAAPNTYLRAASGDLNAEGTDFVVGKAFKISAQGAQLQARQKELVLPLNPATSKEIRLTYQWVQ